MNVYYWSPFLSHIATIKSVKNSAWSLQYFSKNKIQTNIINVIGEWDSYEKELKKKNIKLINFSRTNFFYKKLPKNGFFKTRLSYFLIIFKSAIKLHKFLKNKNKDDIIVIHLIVSLPLILNFFFNYNCNFILRISGLPKLNFIRSTLWKLSNKKMRYVTCPTEGTKNDIIKKNIFDKSKICVLRDPVLVLKDIKNILKKKNDRILNFDYIICIGRLTNQKNFKLIVKNFNKILEIDKNINLVILGEGENFRELKDLSEKSGNNNKIHFLGFKKNILSYLKYAKCFALTSKWEDPGFVLVEAAIARVPILSSNCKHGPREILSFGQGGYLFENDDIDSFLKNYQIFLNDIKNNKEKIKSFKLKNYKVIKQFTIFNHYKIFNTILEKIIYEK